MTSKRMASRPISETRVDTGANAVAPRAGDPAPKNYCDDLPCRHPMAVGDPRVERSPAAVAQADGDRPDGPSMTKVFAESWEAMEARIAELEADVETYREGCRLQAAAFDDLKAENFALKSENKLTDASSYGGCWHRDAAGRAWGLRGAKVDPGSTCQRCGYVAKPRARWTEMDERIMAGLEVTE